MLLLAASALASACLVSFDGYQPLGDGSGGSAIGGDASSGKGNDGGSKANGGGGGKASGGTEQGNAGDGAGGDDSEGGSGMSGGSGGSAAGSAGTGGVATAGSGGAGAGRGGGGNGGAGSGGGGNGGSGGSEPKNCPVSLEGPPLIEIPKPGGGFFCMDRTEATNEDYAAFLATNPSTVSQVTACSFNTTFEPDTTNACASSEQAKYDPVARPKVPVGCIDWCDAKRYCEWTGKRLCGALGGGNNPPASFADASKSEWFRACSKAGTQKFPYGDAYKGTYCNGADVSGTHPDPVANKPACQGGYNGLYDMSGNVAEWEDSCSGTTAASDSCLIRGGSIDNLDVLTPSLLCNSSTPDDATPSPATAKRNAKDELIGIRCCLDP